MGDQLLCATKPRAASSPLPLDWMNGTKNQYSPRSHPAEQLRVYDPLRTKNPPLPYHSLTKMENVMIHPAYELRLTKISYTVEVAPTCILGFLILDCHLCDASPITTEPKKNKNGRGPCAQW